MWIILCCLVLSVLAAEKVNLQEPTKVSVQDQSEIVKLAEEEKFKIPLGGRTISHEIEYIPENSGQCEFVQPSIQYKVLAQSQAIFDNEDQIASLLPLKKRQTVIVADPYYNVASYSIDRHFLMKPRLPKTSLTHKFKESKPINPVLVSTDNQQYVYLLTAQKSYIFHHNNIAAETVEFSLQGKPTMISKAIQSRGFIIVCAGNSGIQVYRIDYNNNMKLKLVQKIEVKDQSNSPVDMELNQKIQLLYVLNYQKNIEVYSFDPVGYTENQQKNQILKFYDDINLETITLNHHNMQNFYELVGHVNIQISRNREGQSILVLFSHEGKTLVAELNYKSLEKKYSFVRYFKFSMMIKQIHVIDELMVVVGDGLLGMFPFGIDPHLIVQQFNGFMTLTPVDRIIITQAPFFVGVSNNEIEYGGIFLNNEAGINCHLSSNSQLKQVRFKANLTVCQDLFQPQVQKYCEYEKTFIIRQMELTASAPVATSIWVATIIFTLLIVVGLCFLFAMHKKKQREIRKLQLYFEQKRRSSQVPVSSERRNNQ